ncbi:MAG TPA: flagellar basal body protein, partial [Mycobacterium sp.]|nr:flagellar basal body protein [Mycobacterium sp.]
MMSGMYAAISGLDAHQTMLNVTANNLANVDTVGYKAQSTQFADQLSQLIQAGTGPNGFNAGTNPV